jgi:hypothetical protein
MYFSKLTYYQGDSFARMSRSPMLDHFARGAAHWDQVAR